MSYLLDATQLMRKVGELSDVTAQEVIESRKAYQGAYDALAPFKRLLDMWISEYFGNKAAQHKTHVPATSDIRSKKCVADGALRSFPAPSFHWTDGDRLAHVAVNCSV